MEQLQPFNMFAAAAPVYQERDRRDQQQYQNAFAERGYQADQFNREQAQRTADQRTGIMQQELGLSRERLDMARQQARAATEAELARLSQAERQQEAQSTMVLWNTIGQLEQRGDIAGIASLLQNEGVTEGQSITPESWPGLKASLAGSVEAVQGYLSAEPEPYAPQSSEGKRYADEQALGVELGGGDTPAAFQVLELRADAMGIKRGTPEYAQFMANGGRQDDGMVIESTPGGFTFRQGAGVGQREEATFGPSAPESMISSIDGILSDGALPYATGLMAPLGSVPGTGARRVKSRMDQLDGQAFLQAFEGLKGGGQITEIEGQKATQAIARLDSYQSVDDYRDALNELRDILVLGSSRPKGWAERRKQQLTSPDVGTVEDGHRYLGGDPADPNSWEPQ